MVFDKNLKELDITALIEFIDNPTNQASIHREETIAELERRNIPTEEIKTVAVEVNKIVAYNAISKEEISKEEVSMHESKFLSDSEIKDIYVEQLNQLMKDKDQFRFDVWSYAIGG